MSFIMRYVPYLIVIYVVVTFPVFIRRAFAYLREERRRREQFVYGRGQVMEISKRSVPSGGDTGQAMFIDYYAARCRFQFSGQDYLAWSDDRSTGRHHWTLGQNVELWLDPAQPNLFVLKPPKSAAKARVESLPLFLVPVVALGVGVGLSVMILNR